MNCSYTICSVLRSTPSNKAVRNHSTLSQVEINRAMACAIQVDTFGDRRGEVLAAMRDVGYGASNWIY